MRQRKFGRGEGGRERQRKCGKSGSKVGKCRRNRSQGEILSSFFTITYIERFLRFNLMFFLSAILIKEKFGGKKILATVHIKVFSI